VVSTPQAVITFPPTHEFAQIVPPQAALAFGWEQLIQLAPHCVTLESLAQVLPHAWNPAVQVKPQLVPLQVAVLLVGAEQAVQEVVPQLLTLVFETHAVPHKWKPELQVNPHVVPLQVAVAFAGGVHGVQNVPQVEMLVLEAQVLPQA
jgi:hypothetical protein